MWQSLIIFSITLFSGRITLSMCKKFKLAKEEADELAELDCNNIITASKEACQNNNKNVPSKIKLIQD